MSEPAPSRPTARIGGEREARTVSVPVTALLSLALGASGVAGGGWYGSKSTADQVAGEMREFRVEMRASLDRLQSDVQRLQQDHATAISRLERDAYERERRLREIELWRAREDARTERDRGAQPR